MLTADRLPRKFGSMRMNAFDSSIKGVIKLTMYVVCKFYENSWWFMIDRPAAASGNWPRIVMNHGNFILERRLAAFFHEWTQSIHNLWFKINNTLLLLTRIMPSSNHGKCL